MIVVPCSGRVGVFNSVGAVAGGFPAGGDFFSGPAGDQLDPGRRP